MRNTDLTALTKDTLEWCFAVSYKSLVASNENWSAEVVNKLDAVSFIISYKSSKTLGRCWYTIGHIELYPNSLSKQTKEHFINVIKHEYAHHLCWVLYKTRGHNKQWRQLCRVLNCPTTATVNY